MGAITELGYLGFEVSDLSQWERFAVDVLGLSVERSETPNGLYLRMDDRAQRFFLTEGDADDCAFIGWQVADDASLEDFGRHLDAEHVQWAWGDADEASSRRVDRLLKFLDPNENRHEAYCGPEIANTPFRSTQITSGFVTGAGGLGHVVFGSSDYAASLDFGYRVLGQRPTDRINTSIGAGKIPLELSFMHVNSRHHSMAIISLPLPKRIHHFMLEVNDLQDVGRAYERTQDFGLEITRTLGQHPNDKMISFYAKTPSGFEVEIGSGALAVHDDNWQVRNYRQMSEWGHRPAVQAHVS
jgi:2,3-dihydroxybiphenyl 1,2-dioxygenase